MANVLVKCDVYECSLDKSRIRPMLFSPAGSSALATYLVIGYTQLVPKFVRSGSAYCGSPLFEAGSICVNPKTNCVGLVRNAIYAARICNDSPNRICPDHPPSFFSISNKNISPN